MKFRLGLVSVMVALGALAPARAQTSAGQLLQDLRSEQQRNQALPTPLPPKALPGAGASAPQGPAHLSFVVQRFLFVGSDKVPLAQLQGAVAPYLNRRIDFDDLKQVTDLVARLFQDRGWLVHVLLPEQDITDGVVTIRVVEARMGEVQIDKGLSRVSDAELRSWIDAHVPPGRPISLAALDRALLTLGDRPDLSASGSLARGAAAGETDLQLMVAPKPLVDGRVSLDAFGDQSTGTTRESVQLDLNGPFGHGTQLVLNAMHSVGNDYGLATYTVPLGEDGLRVGLNASRMSYQVVGQGFQALADEGGTSAGGLQFSYPLLRSRPANVLLSGNWTFSAFQNSNVNGPEADQTYGTNVVQMGLSGNWLGAGLNTFSLMGSGGDIERSVQGQYNNAYDVAGQFLKLRYALTHAQGISPTLSAYLSLSGQVASRNLDSSEQLYLGGPYAVRAYASGQAPASVGELFTAELRQILPWHTQAALFYDGGVVQTWKFNVASNNESNHYFLQGAGLSLSWVGPRGLQLVGTMAHRFGSLDSGVASNLQINGGLDPNRFWVTASLPFSI